MPDPFASGTIDWASPDLNREPLPPPPGAESLLLFEGDKTIGRYADISDIGIRRRIEQEVGRADYQLRAELDRVKALPEHDEKRRAFENFYSRYLQYGETPLDRFTAMLDATGEDPDKFPEVMKAAIERAEAFREGAESEREHYGFVESLIGEVAADPEGFAGLALLETAALVTPVPPGVASALAGGARGAKWVSAGTQAATAATRLGRAGRAARSEAIIGAGGGFGYGVYQHPQTEEAYAAIGAEYAARDNIALDTAAGAVLGGGLGGLIGLFGKGIDPAVPDAARGAGAQASAKFAVLLRNDAGVNELRDRLPEGLRKDISANWDDLPLHIRQRRVLMAYSQDARNVSGIPGRQMELIQSEGGIYFRPADAHSRQLLERDDRFTPLGKDIGFTLTRSTPEMRFYSRNELEELFDDDLDGLQRLITDNGGVVVRLEDGSQTPDSYVLFRNDEARNIVTAKIYMPGRKFATDADAATALRGERVAAARTQRDVQGRTRAERERVEWAERIQAEKTPKQVYNEAKREFNKMRHRVEVKGEVVDVAEHDRIVSDLRAARDALDGFRTLRQREIDAAKRHRDELKAQNERDRAEVKRRKERAKELERAEREATKREAEQRKAEQRAKKEADRKEARRKADEAKAEKDGARADAKRNREREEELSRRISDFKQSTAQAERDIKAATKEFKAVDKDFRELRKLVGGRATDDAAETAGQLADLSRRALGRRMRELDAPDDVVAPTAEDAARGIDKDKADADGTLGIDGEGLTSDAKEDAAARLAPNERDVLNIASALNDMGLPAAANMTNAVAIARAATENAVSVIDILTTMHFGKMSATAKNLGVIARKRREYYNALPNPQYSATLILKDVREAAEAAEQAGKSVEAFRNDARLIADLKANPDGVLVDDLVYKYSPYESVNGKLTRVWLEDGIYTYPGNQRVGDVPKGANKPFSVPATRARSLKWNNLFVDEGFAAMGLSPHELAVTRALDAAKSAPRLRDISFVVATDEGIPETGIVSQRVRDLAGQPTLCVSEKRRHLDGVGLGGSHRAGSA